MGNGLNFLLTWEDVFQPALVQIGLRVQYILELVDICLIL